MCDEYVVDAHPVRLVVEDDLQRNRLTVFFRLILAIPHLIWISLWTIGIVFVVVVQWFVTLITGSPPPTCIAATRAYLRYGTHLNAYLYLVGQPVSRRSAGRRASTRSTLELPEPGPQSRWKTLLPALPRHSGADPRVGAGRRVRRQLRRRARRATRGYSSAGSRGALSRTCAVLGWFAVLARGRMPKGLRDAAAYGIGYGAQSLAYLAPRHRPLSRRRSDGDARTASTVRREHPVHLVGDAGRPAPLAPDGLLPPAALHPALSSGSLLWRYRGVLRCRSSTGS